ncbi:hypothetical protein BDV40DRAFT_273646, partial [Aspergillus tamarii]
MHDRLHKCDVAGCAQTKGFQYKKDLKRHYDTVHRKGSLKGYFCKYDWCSASKSQSEPRGKPGMRYDNFRRHMESHHGF